ncbi:MAG: hypothetical protein L6Q54_01540 [Leptospiraceae bacterium]|nr:hypothetical protein [Leptospiraceae bacterium]MCK6379921.1 hypothetical protein [Leptospiraceae bacterium]
MKKSHINILFVVLGLFIAFNGAFSQDCSDKNTKKSECKEKSQKIGCCKLKYPGGGYDFVRATEGDCKSNENYHKFLGYNNSLCMEWEEK